MKLKKEEQENGQDRQAPEKKGIGRIVVRVITVLVVLITFLGVLLSRACKWLLSTWTNLTMDELVYHLNTELGGTNMDMVWDFIYSCVVVAFLVSLCLVIVCILFRKKKKLYSFLLSLAIILSVLVSVFSVNNVWQTLDISAYAENRTIFSTFIEDNYVFPSDVKLTFPEQKRNLIYIFLESMENTYADEQSGGAFGQNVIPELTQLSLQNENFSGTASTLNGGYAMPGATWTVAAMFAQTAGLPLSIPIKDNQMNTQDSFFPGILTLGDILAREGYRQALMVGSEAGFGGRKLYFEEHGGYEIYDYDYAREVGWIPQDYRVWWGYEDAKLFANAKEKLTEFAASDVPFNFTLLTVDTHFEDGCICGECTDTFGDNRYANVMACSSRQVKAFVEWIQQQDFYENTTIVIAGDHLTMDSDFCEDVPEEYQRKVYTAYLHPAAVNYGTSYREYTTFDNFPTTLAAMGVKIEGERLGLGTNLFSGRATLSEIYGYDVEKSELSKRSAFMEEMTQYIVEKEAERKKEEKANYHPPVKLEVILYDGQRVSFGVKASSVDAGFEVNRLAAAAWCGEQRQDHVIWQDMIPTEDGVWQLDIDLGRFNYERGIYTVHVYAFGENDEMKMLGEVHQKM